LLFHNLLQVFADRYAKSKQIDNSHLPLLFGGFYQKAISHGEKQDEMGNCSYDKENQQITISLNQIYLLNKIGYDKYFATPEYSLTIDFATLTETLAHEIAHYIQFVKHGKSSCESSGTKNKKGKFLLPELVSEHTEFTREIKEKMLNSDEYKKFAKW